MPVISHELNQSSNDVDVPNDREANDGMDIEEAEGSDDSYEWVYFDEVLCASCPSEAESDEDCA